MRGTQDPVPKGYMGSNPIPCTKVSNLSKSCDVDCCVWEKVVFTESFASLIFFIIFVALSMEARYVSLMIYPNENVILHVSEKSFRWFCLSYFE